MCVLSTFLTDFHEISYEHYDIEATLTPYLLLHDGRAYLWGGSYISATYYRVLYVW
jgi:hypothetical protein